MDELGLENVWKVTFFYVLVCLKIISKLFPDTTKHAKKYEKSITMIMIKFQNRYRFFISIFIKVEEIT